MVSIAFVLHFVSCLTCEITESQPETEEATQQAAPTGESTPPADPPAQSDRSSEEREDEEAVRRMVIAESITKLAELGGDRPLWEQLARRRREAEAAEEEARRAKAEERRRAAERRAEAKKQAEAAREQQERAERARRDRDDTARRQKARQLRKARWSTGPWTTLRALERYRMLSEEFDRIEFTPSNPLTFGDVPWPLLHSPARIQVEDVDWGTVDKFFQAVKPHMCVENYRIFVEKSHRRFHPDRWRSKGLLKSVLDTEERGYVAVTAYTVSEALTALWREMKEGRRIQYYL
jgi:hypothetical protein